MLQPIQAEAVSGDPQSLCLWCQFDAGPSDSTVTWSRGGTTLAEVKRRFFSFTFFYLFEFNTTLKGNPPTT